MKRVQRLLLTFARSFSFAAMFLTVFVIFLVYVLGVPLWNRLKAVNSMFTQASGRNATTLLAEVGSGLKRSQSDPFHTHRWLLLGTDEVEGSNRQDILTDTIILVSYQADENVIRLLSFPRDIYLPEYGSKINGLYKTALQQDINRPEQKVGEAIEGMIGQTLDGEIVLSLAKVQDLIDRVGGVPIEVQNAFTDERYPRAGVDVVVVHDPQLLYETIHFEPGWQVMDGETAVKYMRSRYANEYVEQGDQARMRRQKHVIQAVTQHLFQPEIVGNPVVLGSLYDWYANNFMAKISLYELGWFMGSIASKDIPSIETVILPVTEYPVATNEATLFVHPPESKYRQWAYESVDPSWEKLQEFIEENGL